ncbi:MAG TPA: response regulator [Ferruginibacter sp.]|nr:response regulator [Ferruginibacter sp.]
MNSNRPILLVEDDADDCELIQLAFTEAGVKNPFVCFTSGDEALAYLKSTKENIFFIISDVNMPRMNGLDLKKNINKDDFLNDKTIPFVFLTTSTSYLVVKEAYKLCPQGYFQKPNNIQGLTTVVKTIIDYWQKNVLPAAV